MPVNTLNPLATVRVWLYRLTKRALLLKFLQDTGTAILHTADGAIGRLNSQAVRIFLPLNINYRLQIGTR